MVTVTVLGEVEGGGLEGGGVVGGWLVGGVLVGDSSLLVLSGLVEVELVESFLASPPSSKGGVFLSILFIFSFNWKISLFCCREEFSDFSFRV